MRGLYFQYANESVPITRITLTTTVAARTRTGPGLSTGAITHPRHTRHTRHKARHHATTPHQWPQTTQLNACFLNCGNCCRCRQATEACSRATTSRKPQDGFIRHVGNRRNATQFALRLDAALSPITWNDTSISAATTSYNASHPGRPQKRPE